jgi:hypothetical protein
VGLGIFTVLLSLGNEQDEIRYRSSVEQKLKERVRKYCKAGHCEIFYLICCRFNFQVFSQVLLCLRSKATKTELFFYFAQSSTGKFPVGYFAENGSLVTK